MSRLFFTNIPHDCRDKELQEWVEMHGLKVDRVRVVRDLVAGVSPAFGYVYLQNGVEIAGAVEMLDGKQLKGRRLQVRKDWSNERNCW